MFDFLFKRAAKSAASKPRAAAPATVAPPAPPLYDVRSAARHRAESLQHDEAGSLAFLLKCEFAEARLIAAQAILSKPAVRQALDAMRNTDRRVARLMQARLDVLHGQEQLTAASAECTMAAQQLALQPRLTPNQVSELDRRWQALLPLPEALQQAFDVPRRRLAERLTAQTALQRGAIDLLANLQQLPAQFGEALIATAQDRMAQIEVELATLKNAAELESLPKHLLAQCDAAANTVRATIALCAAQQAQEQAAQRARTEQLDQWEACAPNTLQVKQLRREWSRTAKSAEAPTAADELLQVRFETLLQCVAASQAVPADLTESAPESTGAAGPRAPLQTASPHAAQEFIEALSALELALANGSLQGAADADKRIRLMDASALGSNAAQHAQLSRLRAELGRLQGWARWGGNVSREELQKAAEALPAQGLALSELGKQINTLRERWKTLDSSAGPAPKELWLGFDAACTAAYAPVAAHVEKQAAEREQNAELVRALLAEIHQLADQINGAATPDWKAIAQFCQRSVQSFQRLTGSDRRNKKRFDAEFSAALARLREPLAAVQHAEIAHRESMISEAGQLNATERGALDRLKQLQERWQTHARTMPLERDDEQALWRRFRDACDAAFAKRKEHAAEADAERNQHLETKEAVCSQLEAALETAASATQASLATSRAALLRESAAAWSAIGPVPRGAEAALEARYRTAVAHLTQQIEATRRAERDTLRQGVQRKLALCLQAESAVANGGDGAVSATLQTIKTAWQALGADDSATLRLLAQRFARAQACAQHADPAYLNVLQANRAVLLQELLRTEIILSIESPTERARERLQLQVEVLQSVLKSSVVAPTAQSQLHALCGMPAALGADDSTRLLRLVEHLAA